MSLTWHQIHEHLLRSSSTIGFQRDFNLLRQRHVPLSRFTDPPALLDALHRDSDTSEQKNAILRTLVEVAQSGASKADCAVGMLLLALWPGLDAVNHRLRRRGVGDPVDMHSDILGRAIEAVHGLDLGRVHRIAATILMNIERDIGRDRARESRWQSLRVELDVDQIAVEWSVPPISRDHLRLELARLVGDDARLVLRVAVDGFSQLEAAAELGLSEAAARKRYQRATRRLRPSYSAPMSHSGSLPGFLGSGATALSPKKDGCMTHIDDTPTDHLTRMPGLFRRWELSEVFQTRRTYRLEEAGSHSDGTPLVTIFTSEAAAKEPEAPSSSKEAV
jgi:RNA polymerase sigma-70 factor (ECF subfamily)